MDIIKEQINELHQLNRHKIFRKSDKDLYSTFQLIYLSHN